jgi:SAM-dependent methyltransferase/uncharacterized protein YbaR (Trm112 family)
MNAKTTHTTQSPQNLKGEIEFRAKLATQHVSGEVLLPDYYKKEEHDNILLERINATRKRMEELANRGIHLAPFLELGAERGQRSLVLVNDFSANGIAVDISYHQLRTMEHFARLFHRNRLPMRICCDANHLPFRSNSFPFIFCFEFLHHFPSLGPIINEIYRVLSNGHFYFDEEPFKRVFKLRLYKQNGKPYSQERLKRNKYVRCIETFISEERLDEVEHGIIENNDISLTEWMNALSVFDHSDIDLCSISGITSKLEQKIRMRNVLNFVLGGSIAGLCRKNIRARVDSDLTELLGCPNCTIKADCGAFDRPPLVKVSGGFRCVRCDLNYPHKDGIVLLLPKDEMEQLYPDFQ